MDPLSIAKRNLFESLGDNFKKYLFKIYKAHDFYAFIFLSSYLQLLRTWFRNNLTKDEFDFEARKLFNDKTIKKHNAFLLALFTRCQDLACIYSASGIYQSLFIYFFLTLIFKLFVT